MDKYQQAVLLQPKRKTFFSCFSRKSKNALVVDFDYVNDSLILVQEEDIYSTEYKLLLDQNSNISKCYYWLDDQWYDVVCNNAQVYEVILDFNHRIGKIKLEFADNIVDDYVFSVKYVEADKDLYYQKQAEEKRQNYIEKAHIEYAIGACLVNVYFEPCCEDYCRAEIELFRGTRMIAKYKVEEDYYFKAICDLAYGTYGFVLKQYDKNDNLLFETERTLFDIKTPTGSVMKSNFIH